MDGPEIPAGKYVGEGRVFAMRDCGVGRRSRITAIAPDHDVRLQCQPVQLRMEPTATASHYAEENAPERDTRIRLQDRQGVV